MIAEQWRRHVTTVTLIHTMTINLERRRFGIVVEYEWLQILKKQIISILTVNIVFRLVNIRGYRDGRGERDGQQQCHGVLQQKHFFFLLFDDGNGTDKEQDSASARQTID